MKRCFDILFSMFFLIVLFPILLGIALWIAGDSRGGVFFRQIRVGKNGREFKLWKFRTMHPGSEQKGQITIGEKDTRITRVGYFLRKYKWDELPQLFNILKGNMSVVGPRPEVPRYVAHYTPEQRQVLSVRPGLTDYASLEYFSEAEILAQSADPQKTYQEEIMPRKLQLNLKYLKEKSLTTDLKIIYHTLLHIFSQKKPTDCSK